MVRVLRVLGVVQEVAHDGKLIVRGSEAPRGRAEVLDNRKRRLGRVIRVFGPVDSPYISVEPRGDLSLMGMIGKQVYFEGGDEYGKGKGKHRRG